MIKKKILAVTGLLAGFLITAVPAFAHSVVTPNQVGIGATQTFVLSVPTEKDGGTTTNVKLMIPAGLEFVTPVVQAGWTATIKTGPIPSGMPAPKAMDGDLATSIQTEVDWTGGSIPSGEKALLQFSAQAPAQVGELDWKIYQGYADGSTVSWDLGPNDPQPKDSDGNSTFDDKGPYSKTMVVNDLTGSNSGSGMTTQAASNPSSNTMAQSSQSSLPLMLGGLGTILGAIAIAMNWKKS